MGRIALQEKLTALFSGTDIFTTSAQGRARPPSFMWEQNELLRRNAAGNFPKFVQAIAHDPAMLDYLNNQQNKKAHPNENFARELMELFTLGIGNYTENDIKQAARAFTGWAHDGDEYVFRRFEHDDGNKTFMGLAGNFNGDDIIKIIMSRPVCPKYITEKLFSYFVYEDPEEPVVNGFSEIFRDANGDLRPLLKAIFRSNAFFSDKARIGSQIGKSPIPAGGVEPCASRRLKTPTMRPAGIHGPDGAGADVSPQRQRMARREDVDQHQHAVRASFNVALGLVGDAAAVDKEQGTAQEIVDRWVERLVQRPVDPAQRSGPSSMPWATGPTRISRAAPRAIDRFHAGVSAMLKNLTTRREFMHKGMALVAVGATVPAFLSQTLMALENPLDSKLTPGSTPEQRRENPGRRAAFRRK